ncbi:LacI family DNA-binding transcriptional regulator [Aestuariimicrobium ganziense]|uniref:LacI family DNA-binding transcriptional regulator n=1 Tax=Aestuariimicrobium ganziense TaxID=2773677 RepID=UPI0019446857|nr:LacI family DNA-binding transcriptional regulator [Aestuariimicrobium ganziense]
MTETPQPERDASCDKPPTIYDVAAAAGVNPSTVSRAFSRPGRVSDRTAVHIHAVAAELGYRSRSVFRLPRTKRTSMIALALSDVTNPFFFSIIRGAEEECSNRGYSLVVADAQESPEKERQLFERTLPVVDGLLVASSRMSDTALRAAARKVPTILLNRVVTGLPCVVPDHARGTRRALEHVAELGHRRIAYVAGPDASWANGVRYRAFREGCYELELIDSRIGPGAPTVRGGQALGAKLLEAGVTAAICFNDLMAIGVMRTLSGLGVRVPQEMSVVGFDNTFASDLVSPGLTTVAAPLGRIGQAATSSLIGMIEHDHKLSTAPMVLPTQLIERGSTARPLERDQPSRNR